MIGRLRSRVSSAHVLALIALLVAIGGTAYAGSKINSGDVENDSLKSKDLKKDKAVKSSDVQDGTLASEDLAAEAQGARAYGLVSGAGALSRSKNATITHPATGVYCITPTGIDVNGAVLLVSPDFQDDETSYGAENQSHPEWDSGNDTCPAGTLEAQTALYNGDGTDNDTGGGNTTGDSFALNDEGFSFVVP